MKNLLSLLLTTVLSVTFVVPATLAQESGPVTTTDAKTGVTTTTTKTSGGTKTEVFDPTTGVTTTTIKASDGKTFTSTSKKDATTGIITTDFTDFDGTTGTITEETDALSGNVIKTIKRSDSTTSISKKDKNGTLMFKSFANTKTGYTEDYETTATGYKESHSLTWQKGGKPITETHSHEVKGKNETSQDQLIVDGTITYDVLSSKFPLEDSSKVQATEVFIKPFLFYNGQEIKFRSRTFDSQTGKTTVVWQFSNGSRKEFAEGEYEAELQPQTTTPTEKKAQSQPTGENQGKPSKRPKKEVKHTGTAVKHVRGKNNAKPETSAAAHAAIGIGAGILLNQLGHGGGGHDVGHHERGMEGGAAAPDRMMPGRSGPSF